MNNTEHCLKDVFADNSRLMSHRKLSRAIYRQTGQEQKIMVRTDRALDLYLDVDKKISQASPLFGFIQKGIGYFRQRVDNGLDIVSMNAHSIAQLNYLIEEYQLTKPKWLPIAFREESGSSGHRYQYFFDWSTIDPDFLPKNETRAIELALRKYANEHRAEIIEPVVSKPAPKPSGPETMQDIKVDKVLNSRPQAKVGKVEKDSEKDSEKDALDAHNDVMLSLAASHCFIDLYERTKSENLPFDLSVQQVCSLLSKEECYFSKKSIDINSSGNNRPSLVLIDNDKGAIHGNVVLTTRGYQKTSGLVDADKVKACHEAIKVLEEAGIDTNKIFKD